MFDNLHRPLYVRKQLLETRQTIRGASRQDGFTLIELLVALVLGLVVIGGVLSIFSETRRSFRLNENLGRIQENARTSFELLSREIREAGSTPCGTRAMANVVRTAGVAAWYADWPAGTVRGFDGAQDSIGLASFGTAIGDRVAGTDAVIVLRNVSDEASIRVVTAHDTTGHAFAVQPNPTTYYNDADLFTVCDSTSGAIVQVNSVSNSLSEIEYGLSIFNCSTNLGYPTGSCATPPARTFDAGAVITKYDPVFWYVGVNAQQQRSLYRLRVTTTGGAGSRITITRTEEMIPSIRDMQIQYLVRDTAAANALATSWIDASDATFSTASGAWSEANLKQIVAVRISIILNSEENVGATGLPLQREFISVSALRSKDLP